jgi:hypothetical protein
MDLVPPDPPAHDADKARRYEVAPGREAGP